VLLGATVTYSVQKRLQRDSEKRGKNAEYVEKYYGPLLVEIQKIQETVLNDVSNYYDFHSLEDFKTRPQFYTMGKKLREDFLTFTVEIVKLVDKIGFYRGRVKDLIREIGDAHVVSPLGRRSSFVSDLSYSPVYLKYCRESERFAGTLDDCILLGKSPVDLVKGKVAHFQEESLEVEFYVDVELTGLISAHTKEYDRKSFHERKEILDEIVLKVNAGFDKDDGYRNFQSELADIRKKAASLSVRIRKYVERYVSTVDT